MKTVILLCLAAALRAPQEAPRSAQGSQGEDPRAVVLSLGYRGGFLPAREAAREETPYLEVLADGTLRVPPRRGQKAEMTDELGPEELEELVHFVVETHRIFEFDPLRAKRDLERLHGDDARVRLMDAADTVVTAALDGRRIEARFNALEYFARQFPGVPDLDHLNAIRRRLQSTMCVVQLGGKARASELLELANERLAERHAGAEPLQLTDYSSVSFLEDGARRVFLERTGKVHTLVTLDVAAQGEVDVSVERRPLERDR